MGLECCMLSVLVSDIGGSTPWFAAMFGIPRLAKHHASLSRAYDPPSNTKIYAPTGGFYTAWSARPRHRRPALPTNERMYARFQSRNQRSLFIYILIVVCATDIISCSCCNTPPFGLNRPSKKVFLLWRRDQFYWSSSNTPHFGINLMSEVNEVK